MRIRHIYINWVLNTCAFPLRNQLIYVLLPNICTLITYMRGFFHKQIWFIQGRIKFIWEKISTGVVLNSILFVPPRVDPTIEIWLFRTGDIKNNSLSLSSMFRRTFLVTMEKVIKLNLLFLGILLILLPLPLKRTIMEDSYSIKVTSLETYHRPVLGSKHWYPLWIGE